MNEGEKDGEIGMHYKFSAVSWISKKKYYIFTALSPILVFYKMHWILRETKVIFDCRIEEITEEEGFARIVAKFEKRVGIKDNFD